MKLNRRTLLLITLACFGAGLWQDSRPAATEVKPVSVFLVRHAEKAKDDPRDPTLSEEGVARAVSLSRLVGESGVTHLFASEYKRTQLTLEPLAKAKSLEVEVVSARTQPKLLKLISELAPGSVAVVAGHSNTVPAIASALGCELPNLTETRGGPMLAEDEYDRLFLLTLPPADAKGVAPTVIELRY